ncbi:toxin Cry1Ac domain D-VI-related protein, partial [Listeria booriae]
MTSKKTLAKKAVKTMAVAAVAFSVVAQPLSMIVSADEVTPKAERQLLGATSNNTIPVKLTTPTFTTQAGVAGFNGWTGVYADATLNSSVVKNITETTSSVPDANGYITLAGYNFGNLISYANNTGFTVKPNWDGGGPVTKIAGLEQTISTIPGKKYNVKVDLTTSNVGNYAYPVIAARDTSSKTVLGAVQNQKTYDFIATSTSTDLLFMGSQTTNYSNIAVSQYVDTIVDNITNASTTVTGTALANQAVEVKIGDKVYMGTTDGTGKFSIDIEPPAAGQSVVVTCNYDVIPVTVTDALTPAAKTAADALFIDNNPSKDIKDTTTQADIDAAQAAVNKAPESAAKADLQKEIENAQAKLDVKTQAAATTAATTSVDNLFINNDPSKDIKDTTKQADIDAAQAAVNKITDPTTKADLQKDIDKAQTQLDAKTAEAAAEAAATTATDALFVNNDP